MNIGTFIAFTIMLILIGIGFLILKIFNQRENNNKNNVASNNEVNQNKRR